MSSVVPHLTSFSSFMHFNQLNDSCIFHLFSVCGIRSLLKKMVATGLITLYINLKTFARTLRYVVRKWGCHLRCLWSRNSERDQAEAKQ